MNIGNVALLLGAGNVSDGTAIEHSKLACLLLTVGAP
jgi:hypothetical protein